MTQEPIPVEEKPNFDIYFSKEELKREKRLPPLTQKEKDLLDRLANAILDRFEEDVANGRLKLNEE